MEEDRPGRRWRELLKRTWPAYLRWFLLEGDDARPDLRQCRSDLARHMPELVPLWEELTELADGDERVARMLSLVDPAPYVTGCSQVIWIRGDPALIRNYDYRPWAFEGTILKTRWHETAVMAVSDCLWGALDGVNEHGLVVALAFGGSPIRGRGFGIPLILRYILEFCRTVDDAAEVLRHVPSHMAYNVSLLDASGHFATVFLTPQRKARVVREHVATNHQPDLEWSRYAKVTRSLERHRFLTDQLEEGHSIDRLIARFLKPPLYVNGHAKGYGTLYTVAYRPGERSAEFLWPHNGVRQALDSFEETALTITYPE